MLLVDPSRKPEKSDVVPLLPPSDNGNLVSMNPSAKVRTISIFREDEFTRIFLRSLPSVVRSVFPISYFPVFTVVMHQTSSID